MNNSNITLNYKTFRVETKGSNTLKESRRVRRGNKEVRERNIGGFRNRVVNVDSGSQICLSCIKVKGKHKRIGNKVRESRGGSQRIGEDNRYNHFEDCEMVGRF